MVPEGLPALGTAAIACGIGEEFLMERLELHSAVGIRCPSRPEASRLHQDDVLEWSLGHLHARVHAVAHGHPRRVREGRRSWRSFRAAAALTGQSDGSAIYLRADVTDPASLEKLAAGAFEHLGRIDAVVNLAGISPRKAIEDYTSADVDALLAVNVKGPIFVTQAFLPGLRTQAGGGVVVHLGGAWTAGWRCRS